MEPGLPACASMLCDEMDMLLFGKSFTNLLNGTRLPDTSWTLRFLRLPGGKA